LILFFDFPSDRIFQIKDQMGLGENLLELSANPNNNYNMHNNVSKYMAQSMGLN